MSDTPRYYKWYPTVSCDLGTMPFEGDWTVNDRIVQIDVAGMQVIYCTNASGTEFGRFVTKKVGKRLQNVWEPGVTVYPMELSGVTCPVWFMYYGDGVCTVKLPAGEQLETVEVN